MLLFSPLGVENLKLNHHPGVGGNPSLKGFFFSVGITLSGLVCMRQLHHFSSGSAGEYLYCCYEFACILSPKRSRNVAETLGLKCNNLIRVCMPSAGYYRLETGGYFIHCNIFTAFIPIPSVHIYSTRCFAID